MRRITWRFWVGAAALAVAWLAGGFLLPADFPANDLYDVAAVGAFGASLLFVVIYTVRGFTGPAKWWTNDLGTALVIAVGSLMAVTGIPAFAVIFNGGLINTHWWAWSFIGGTAVAAGGAAYLTWLGLRAALGKDRT